jgi:hypothetical protein
MPLLVPVLVLAMVMVRLLQLLTRLAAQIGRIKPPNMVPLDTVSLDLMPQDRVDQNMANPRIAGLDSLL